MAIISGGVVNSPAETISETVLFTEAGAGTYTGSVTVPASSLITDIKVYSTVLWAAATSAAMDVGDAGDANGWYAAIDLKATDLLVGEEINFIQTGGKEGAYLNTTTGARSAAYTAAARVVSGVVTSVGAGTAGRTYMTVQYLSTGAVGAATKA